jgi:hypothetical protein
MLGEKFGDAHIANSVFRLEKLKEETFRREVEHERLLKKRKERQEKKVKDELARKKEDEEKQKKIKAHEHITAVLHQVKDSSGETFLKAAKKLPTVGAVKKYLRLKCPNVSKKERGRVNKKNILKMWTELESKLPTVEVAPEEDLLGPDPTLDM